VLICVGTSISFATNLRHVVRSSAPSLLKSNSTSSSSSNIGTYLTYSASNTLIRNTFASGASQPTVYIYSSSGNTFALNNFTTATSSYYIQDQVPPSTNFYNTTVGGINQGNIYPNVMSGSVQVSGTIASSIPGLYVGNSGTGYPYGPSTSGGKMQGATDNAPLTPHTCAWTQRTSAGSRYWYGLASSSDGTKLAAGTGNTAGYIYTSTDSGATWAPRTGAGSKWWSGIASSSDGTKLAAVDYSPGNVWLSADSGATWASQASAPTTNWWSIASSSDGNKLVAAPSPGYIWTYSCQ